MAITLEELLASRDARREKEMVYLRRYPQYTLMVLTIVVPGSDKRTRAAKVVAHAAVDALREEFGDAIFKEEICDLVTGFEAYLLLSVERENAKIRAIGLEERHPLGRLMDIDVIGEDGTPFGRGAMRRAPRKCIICDNDARVCMRAATHTPLAIDNRINQMVDEYLLRH